jgi:hypothetical protein
MGWDIGCFAFGVHGLGIWSCSSCFFQIDDIIFANARQWKRIPICLVARAETECAVVTNIIGFSVPGLLVIFTCSDGALTSHGCLVKQVAILSGHDIERIRYYNGCTYKDCDGHRNAMHSCGFDYCGCNNAFLWRINKFKPYTNSAHRICFLDGLIWQAKSKTKSQVSHSDTRTKRSKTSKSKSQ